MDSSESVWFQSLCTEICKNSFLAGASTLFRLAQVESDPPNLKSNKISSFVF